MAESLPRSVRTYAALLESQPELLRGAEALPDTAPSGNEGRGAELLREVETFYSRFAVLPEGAWLPLALWTMGTHLFDCFETFPYVALLSPEKGCGKTRTTEIIELLAANPLRAVCASEAALFRLIEDKQPTLILDEAEVLTGKGERADAVRAILNAGNRTGTTVPRCVGQSHELQYFAVYCPKVVCAIRVCPDTLRDRSIVIPMQRKRPTDTIERFILRRVRPEGEAMRARLANWARVNRAAVSHAYERLDANFLSDRDLENTEPLLAVLTVADSSRLAELRTAAEALAGLKRRDAEDESLSLRLLADVREVWPEKERTIFSATLLKHLKDREESPWAEEKQLNARKLSEMLRPYGIGPAGTVRVGEETRKGYRREEAEEAFARYLAPETSQASQSA